MASVLPENIVNHSDREQHDRVRTAADLHIAQWICHYSQRLSADHLTH